MLMNAIEGSLRYIKARVNKRILEDAFLDEDDRRLRGTSDVNSAIVEKVIREFVIPDLSRIGGKTADIELVGLQYDYLDQWTRSYYIPPERREGRNIVKYQYVARSVYAGSTTVVPNYFTQVGRRQGISLAAEKMLNANLPVNQTMTADIEQIGPNTFSVRDFDLLHISPILKCKLELSPNLEEIGTAYHSELNILIYEAARRYIYNELNIDMDMGKLEGGRELGAYSEAVRDMSDAAVAYDEELKKWYKYLILTDKRSAQAHYRSSGK